jgi:hypothetical protein
LSVDGTPGDQARRVGPGPAAGPGTASAAPDGLDPAVDVLRVVRGPEPALEAGGGSTRVLLGDPPGPLYLRDRAEGWTALTAAVVLAGWRDTGQALALLDLLALRRLQPLRLRMEATRALPGAPSSLGTLAALVALTSWSPAERPGLLADLRVALRTLDPVRVVGTDPGRAVLALRRLLAAHPDDPAVLAALLLRRIELAAGASIELGPGTPRLLLTGQVSVQSGREAVVAGLDPRGQGTRPRTDPTVFAGLLAADSDIRLVST